MFLENLIIFAFLIITTSASALHESCERNEQCGTLDTYCKNSTCVCKDDFMVFYDHCIRLATPYISCTHKSQCSNILGPKVFCKNEKCACKSFHHLHNNQCIKSRGLDEQCEHNYQCYCGQDCKETIECSNEKMCACKFGFKRYSRKCIPDPNVIILQATESSESGSQHFFINSYLSLLWIFFIRYY